MCVCVWGGGGGEWPEHAKIQKILSGGGTTFFLPLMYFTEGHTDLLLKSKRGPIASRGGL